MRLPWAYRTVMTAGTPAVRWWGRLRVEGLEHVPAQGPVVLMANHDSAWDPVVVGIAAASRRQVRALAKDTLWKNKAVAWVLDHMGQIPVSRGRGGAAWEGGAEGWHGRGGRRASGRAAASPSCFGSGLCCFRVRLEKTVRSKSDGHENEMTWPNEGSKISPTLGL